MNSLSATAHSKFLFRPKSLTYRREIDGLRALAIIPVILFHAGFETFSGGFVGVDVFFVISGYLITSIIIHELYTDTFSLLNFYERRARRILPALALVLAASSIAALVLLWPSDLLQFSRSLRYVLGFCSNLFFEKNSGYFDIAAEMQPLLHTWSLAIEEQYYILIPPTLMLLWRFDKTVTLYVFIAIAVASLTFSEYNARHNADSGFFFFSTRIWELLVGSLLAFGFAFRPDNSPARTRLGPYASAAGFLAILYAVFTFDRNTTFPGFNALLPVVGAALIIYFATPKDITSRILSNKIAVGIGLISYSLYLWHYPVFAFARHALGDEPSEAQFAALIVTTGLLAYLSYRFVERPFRLKKVTSVRQLSVMACSSVGTLLLLSVMAEKNRGFENYHYANTQNLEIKKIHTLISSSDSGTPKSTDAETCRFITKSITVAVQARFDACVKKLGPAIVIFGDSHAEDLYNALVAARWSPFVVGLAKGDCIIKHEPRTKCYYGELKQFVAHNKLNIGQLIYHQAAHYLLVDQSGKKVGPRTFAGEGKFRIRPSHIEETKQFLENLSLTRTVTWIGPFPEARRNMKNYNEFLNGFTMNANALDAFHSLEAALKKRFASDLSSVNFIPFSDLMQPKSEFLRVGDCITYNDFHHLSTCGERIVGAAIMPRLSQRLSSID